MGPTGNPKPEPPEEVVQPNAGGPHSDSANDVYHEVYLFL